MYVVVGANKAIQIQAKIPYASLNISKDQTFFVGLTASGF